MPLRRHRNIDRVGPTLRALAIAFVFHAGDVHALTIALYPLDAVDAPWEVVRSMQGLVVNALDAAASRGLDVQPASPLELEPDCDGLATAKCVGKRSKKGAVIFGTVTVRAGVAELSLALADAKGATAFEKARVTVEFENAAPILDALERLVRAYARLRAPPIVTARPSTPAAALTPVEPGMSQGTVGAITLGAGVVCLLVGFGLAAYDRDASAAQFAHGPLAPAGEQANLWWISSLTTTAQALLVVGGLGTGAGAVLLWTAPPTPASPAQIGVGGRF